MPEIKWKDVFNCEKIPTKSFEECKEIARNVGYNFMCFNGLVYSVLAIKEEYYIYSEDYLD